MSIKTGYELEFEQSGIAQAVLDRFGEYIGTKNFETQYPNETIRNFLLDEIYEKCATAFSDKNIDAFLTLPNVHGFEYGKRQYVLVQEGLNRADAARFKEFRSIPVADRDQLKNGLKRMYLFVKILYTQLCLELYQTSFMLKSDAEVFTRYLDEMNVLASSSS